MTELNNIELNKIYEISRLLSSPDNLRDDFKEVADIIVKHFSTKYLTPINVAVSSHKQYCSTHPSREVNLLQALKPFFENTSDIDYLNKMIDAVNTIRLFTSVTASDNSLVNAASVSDSAIHPDGIYEVDEGCVSADSQNLDKMFNLDGTVLIWVLLLFMFVR
jgi:hypothetical protein